jgi:hypothetical protein
MTSPRSGRRSTSCELAYFPSFHPPIPLSPEWFRCSDSSVLLLRLSVAVPSMLIEIFWVFPSTDLDGSGARSSARLD